MYWFFTREGRTSLLSCENDNEAFQSGEQVPIDGSETKWDWARDFRDWARETFWVCNRPRFQGLFACNTTQSNSSSRCARHTINSVSRMGRKRELTGAGGYYPKGATPILRLVTAFYTDQFLVPLVIWYERKRWRPNDGLMASQSLQT